MAWLSGRTFKVMKKDYKVVGFWVSFDVQVEKEERRL